MTRQIVHDDNVAGSQARHENLVDIGLKADAVDRLVEDEGGATDPESADERRRLPVAVWHASPEPFTPQAATVPPRHVRRGPGFVDKDQFVRIEIELAIEPGLPLLYDVGAILLRRVSGLFLRVMS